MGLRPLVAAFSPIWAAAAIRAWLYYRKNPNG
jgi:hypothetical protein